MKHSSNEQFHTHQCVQTLCTIGMCNKAQLKRKGIKHVLWLLFSANIIDKSYYQSLIDCVENIKESDLENHYCTAFGPNQGCAKEWQEIIDNFEQAVLELQEFNRQVSRHPQRLPMMTPEIIADEFDAYTVAAFQKDNNPKVVDLPEFHRAKDLHARVKILFQNIKQKFPQLQTNQISAVTPPSVLFKPEIRSPFLNISPEGQRGEGHDYDDNRPEFTGEVQSYNSTTHTNGSLTQSSPSPSPSPSPSSLTQSPQSPQSPNKVELSSKINAPETFDQSDDDKDETSPTTSPTKPVVDNNANAKKKKKRPKNKLPWWWTTSTAKRPKSKKKKDDADKVIKIISNKEGIDRLRAILSNTKSTTLKRKSHIRSKSVKRKSATRSRSKSIKRKSRTRTRSRSRTRTIKRKQKSTKSTKSKKRVK